MNDAVQARRSGRHYGMDWLRIGAFGLLIFYHIGMYFVHWDWHVKIAEPIERVAIPMLATNAWRLALLFVVSGFASAALFAKLGGAGTFLKSRTKRLLVPLVFAMIVIVPPQPWVELQFKHGYSASYWQFWTSDYFRFEPLEGIALPTWQHLWFVVYLFVYTLAVGLLALILPVRVRTRIADGAAALLGGWRLLVVPLIWLAMVDLWLFPDHDDTHALFDDGPLHLVYFPMLLVGWLIHVRPALWGAVRQWWKPAAVLAVAGYAVVATVEYIWPGNNQPPADVIFAYQAARVVNGWCAIVALLGVADRFLDHDHPWRATLAEAVFPFYIIHQTIIVLVGWWLLPFDVGPLPSFTVLVGATVAGCWLFYAMGRRIGWVRPLIGLGPEARPIDKSVSLK